MKPYSQDEPTDLREELALLRHLLWQAASCSADTPEEQHKRLECVSRAGVRLAQMLRIQKQLAGEGEDVLTMAVAAVLEE